MGNHRHSGNSISPRKLKEKRAQELAQLLDVQLEARRKLIENVTKLEEEEQAINRRLANIAAEKKKYEKLGSSSMSDEEPVSNMPDIMFGVGIVSMKILKFISIFMPVVITYFIIKHWQVEFEKHNDVKFIFWFLFFKVYAAGIVIFCVVDGAMGFKSNAFVSLQYKPWIIFTTLVSLISVAVAIPVFKIEAYMANLVALSQEYFRQHWHM